jgi:hypothetical protein
MIDPVNLLIGLIMSSLFSTMLLMKREGLRTARGSTAAIVTIIVPVVAFMSLLGINYVVRNFTPQPEPLSYKSSMGIYDPIRGIIHIECNNGKPDGDRKLDVRALGIMFDPDEETRILLELNDVPPDQYSPTESWLKDAGLCKAYVR